MEQMKDMRNTFIKFGWEVLGISWEVWEYVRDQYQNISQKLYVKMWTEMCSAFENGLCDILNAAVFLANSNYQLSKLQIQ